MLIEIDETFLFRLMKEKIESLEKEVAGRMMKPINDRQGGTIGSFPPTPIDVDLDRIHTNEGRLAAATIMNRANQTYDFLNKEPVG